MGFQKFFIVGFNTINYFLFFESQDKSPNCVSFDDLMGDKFFSTIAQVSPDVMAFLLRYYEVLYHVIRNIYQDARDWMDSIASTYTNLGVSADCGTKLNGKHGTAATMNQLIQAKLVLSLLFLSNSIIQLKISNRKLFIALEKLVLTKVSKVASSLQSRYPQVNQVLATNPSHEIHWLIFLSEAYRANLYYSGLNNSNQASEITRDVLTRTDVQLQWTSPFGSGLFLLQICLEWPLIFDANIQVIIGFLNLRQFVLRRKVSKLKWIKVCPVLFLHYIHIQSLHRLNRLNFGEICRMFAHLEICLVDRQINKLSLGPLVIVAALFSNKIDLLRFHTILESLNQVTIDKLRTIPASTITGFFKLYFATVKD